MGIQPDESWYDIPVRVREQMIATKLARSLIEAASSQEAMEEAYAKS